jgi:hypothetical protein
MSETKKITVNIKKELDDKLKDMSKFKGGYTALINYALEAFLKSNKAKQWMEFYDDEET